MTLHLQGVRTVAVAVAIAATTAAATVAAQDKPGKLDKSGVAQLNKSELDLLNQRTRSLTFGPGAGMVTGFGAAFAAGGDRGGLPPDGKYTYHRCDKSSSDCRNVPVTVAFDAGLGCKITVADVMVVRARGKKITWEIDDASYASGFRFLNNGNQAIVVLNNTDDDGSGALEFDDWHVSGDAKTFWFGKGKNKQISLHAYSMFIVHTSGLNCPVYDPVMVSDGG